MSPLLVVLLAVLVSGGSGYFLSYRFNRSDYAATNTSGDFGTPRGGFFALLGGVLIGMLFFNLGGQFGFFSGATVGLGLIVSMVAGALGGVVGMLRGLKSRSKK
ncbi:MAG: hypothetical protein K2W82_15950 [Candidatus Obscuribacterales bacterium]|nr:hypothetical protein [Candidatus Obscuribacterales bacterium]